MSIYVLTVSILLGVVTDYASKFREIDLLVAALPNEPAPNNWRTLRQLEEQRLIAQLYDEASDEDEDALDAAHQDWLDRKDQQAADQRAEAGVVLIAADPWTRKVQNRAFLRLAWSRGYSPSPHLPAPRPRASRPRGRRQRHIARSTSSADPGDSSEPDDDGPLARSWRAFCVRFERAPGSVAVRLVYRPEGRRDR